MTLTIPDKILLAAEDLRQEKNIFTAEDLVVSAWKKFPDTFGLAGYAKWYPDSNRILSNIMGSKGLRAKNWIRKVGEKQYKLTQRGIDAAALLLIQSSENPEKAEGFLRAAVERRSMIKLEKLLQTNAARKALGFLGGEISFNDACGFWDISPRSNASTLNLRLSEIGDLFDHLQKWIAHDASGSAGLQLSRLSIEKKDILLLVDLFKQMQEQFQDEISVIMKRRDERGRKRKLDFE